MPQGIDRFIPVPDVKERHATVVEAPAELVIDVAERFDLESIRLVHALFWLRARILRARDQPRRRRQGLVEELTGLGWGVLAREPGRLLVLGSATRPWEADVRFEPVPPDRFVSFAEADRVKIAVSLEAEPLGPARARFATETRVEATDAGARRRFRRYWRAFGAGIVLIRWLLVPAVRREAERRFRAASRGGPTPAPLRR